MKKKTRLRDFKVKKNKKDFKIAVFLQRRPDREHYNNNQHQHYELILKTLNGREVGRAEYGCNPLNAYVTALQINPQYRRLGIAKRLCKLVVQESRKLEKKMAPFHIGVHAFLQPEEEMKEVLEYVLKKGGFEEAGDGLIYPTKRLPTKLRQP